MIYYNHHKSDCFWWTDLVFWLTYPVLYCIAICTLHFMFLAEDWGWIHFSDIYRFDYRTSEFSSTDRSNVPGPSAWESWMFKPRLLAFWYIVPCSIQWTFVIWGPVSGWTCTDDTEGSVYCRLVLQTQCFFSVWHSATARKMTPELHTGEKCQHRSWCRSVFNSSGRLGLKCSQSRFGTVAVISSAALYHRDSLCF